MLRRRIPTNKRKVVESDEDEIEAKNTKQVSRNPAVQVRHKMTRSSRNQPPESAEEDNEDKEMRLEAKRQDVKLTSP